MEAGRLVTAVFLLEQEVNPAARRLLAAFTLEIS
jgi:hypothetical protein